MSGRLRSGAAAVLVSALALAAVAASHGRGARVPAPTDEPDAATCEFYNERGRKTDYRLRDSSALMRREFQINWKFHTGVAIELLRQGKLGYDVIDNLNFTLQRWPNHRDALRALITYTLRGGRNYQFAPTECYLRLAREFAPDDTDVMLAQAYFHHRQGNLQRAKGEYLEVLALKPQSAEAHYDLGLLYFEQADFRNAREQARLAYAAGYPLAGLRLKLLKAGYPLDEPAAGAATRNH